jgi:peptidoglycan/LPS O-acetylase OafA/YrhL
MYEYKQLAGNVVILSGLVSYAVFLTIFYYLLQILTIYPTEIEKKYIGLIIAVAVSYAAAFLVLHKLSETLLKFLYQDKTKTEEIRQV